MIDRENFLHLITKLKQKKNLFVICDGYDGWNWGFPINPICFNYKEYIKISDFFKTKFGFDIEQILIKNNKSDCLLSENIICFTNKRVCTFISYPFEDDKINKTDFIPSIHDWNKYLFKSEMEINKSSEDKQALLKKILKEMNKETEGETISEFAFEKRLDLKQFIVQNDVKKIGRYAFWGCEELEKVFLSESLIEIGDYAFTGCKKLFNFEIPNSTKMIGDYSFGSCSSLSEIVFPKSVEIIGESAFWFCEKLAQIKFSNSIKLIGKRAFRNCPVLCTVNVSNDVLELNEEDIFIETCIEYEAFSDCKSLKRVSIPKSIYVICESAFRNCVKLSHITISENLKKIKFCAFAGCSSLSDIVYKGTKKQWNEVVKELYWNDGVPSKVVHCIDGDAQLD